MEVVNMEKMLFSNLKSYIHEHLPNIKVADDLEMLIKNCFDSNNDMICEDDSSREISCLIYNFKTNPKNNYLKYFKHYLINLMSINGK